MLLKFLRRFLKDEVDEQTRLKEQFQHFRDLLDANNQALEIMADMEEKLSGDFLFDTGYLYTQTEKLGARVSQMAAEVNRLTGGRFPELPAICRRLQEEIQRELAEVPVIPETPYVLPLTALNRESAPAVGSKMANLGEVRHQLGLCVPEGFAITATAYKRFMEAAGLAQVLEDRLAQTPIDDLESLEAASRELQTLVRQAPLPPDLEAALAKAAGSLPSPWVAVRSSAVGEDTDFSFAGQFATLLNVDAARLPRHYKEILASKFTARAIFYLKYQQFSVNELPMAVGVLAMVPARASGIMFSTDPHDPEANNIIITAVWGLGKYAVDGRVSPDIYLVSRENGHPVKDRRVAAKSQALACRPEGGTWEVDLSPEQAWAPALSDAQIQALAEVALRLEQHFRGPQDVEWAVDEAGRLVILQSRPLRVSPPAFAAPRERYEPSAPPLLTFGIRAVGGVAVGRVHLFGHDDEVAAIPPGAVVVARQPSARLVLVMDRISAIITEVGSPTDHMTILAREFQVPTLVEVGGATKVLHPGQLITVDADEARVYPGLVTELLQRAPKPDEALRNAPVVQKLRRILKLAAPLNLIDPESPDFVAGSCRTFHDITRFCHEKAMDAMFSPDIDRALKSESVARLKTELPLNLFILDLGGGLRVSGKSQVEEEDIVCRPFRALLRGFHHPQVRWAGMVAPDLKGFISVWANTMYDMGKGERGLGGKSFAIITHNYLNFNSRLGYHFGLVDAYISEERNDNYISFQFKGGAAAISRRERRAKLLLQILDDLGFKAQAKGDLVQGRLVKYSLMETEETMELVGLLMAFVRQLDLALASDAVAERCIRAFKKEDYGLACLRTEG
ncbi:MAG: pyruvate, phosphate dikinase [Deltaproteobacteria bacterium]|nr:pyruvate, phosphate dikinase [Deltaproteobacteria bacterium]